LRTGEEVYRKRLVHYLPVQFEELPDIRGGGKLSSGRLRQAEGAGLLSKLAATDRLILLDEGGKSFTSTDFADHIQRQLQRPERRLVFAIGGAFGFSEEVHERADAKLSLSPMTFSHQMIRLFFLEQLYRAMTILRNEKYHNP
jgi:23S rRNA (pseudouridine1915-N3)-methyltransferase